MYTTRMDKKHTNDKMFQHYKYLDDNLVWLTQKTEEPRGNKGSFTFPKQE